jgi:hypothetical protein
MVFSFTFYQILGARSIERLRKFLRHLDTARGRVLFPTKAQNSMGAARGPYSVVENFHNNVEAILGVVVREQWVDAEKYGRKDFSIREPVEVGVLGEYVSGVGKGAVPRGIHRP